MLVSQKTSTWPHGSARLPSSTSSNIRTTGSQSGEGRTPRWSVPRGAVQSGRGTPRLGRDGHSASPGRELVTGSPAVLWDSRRSPWSVSSESAFEQAVTPTPGGTHLLGPEPLHHVAGVSAVPAGQAEVGRPSHGHVADGALEREALADGALRAADLVPAVAAVHAELDPFVRVRGTGNKLQHFRALLSQPPAIEDFSVAFLKVIKLLGISRIQESFVFVMLVTLSLPRVAVGQTPEAHFFR